MTRPRKGMTLVELMVAVVLLAVGLLSMAALSIVLNAQARGTQRQQTAAMLVQSRIDSLASIHCQNLAPLGTQSGVAINRGITERWSVMDGNDTKIIRDTVTFAGRTNPIAYVSLIPCRD